ncbi:MAG: alpha/beta hydrolase [Acidimicrobiia bacterium]|nr:alpha/beta hydrolase [Acidimicrobiia bacterium]
MTNPVALATSVWGNGLRRALLLHGLTSSGPTWWRVGEALAERGFTVVAPDLRAHGMSPKGDSVSIQSHRDDVLLLGRGWDLLIGHSLGGAIAASVVAASSDFAARVVLEDPAIDSTVTTDFVADSPKLPMHPTEAAVAAENPGWDRKDVAIKVEALLACGPHIIERTLGDASPWDIWPDILGSPVPTMIVAADAGVGSLVSAEKEQEVRATAGHLHFERIPGAGHSVHRDAFSEFVDLVEGFAGA